MAEPQFAKSVVDALGNLGYVKIIPQGGNPSKTDTMGSFSVTNVNISFGQGGSVDQLVQDLSSVAQGNPITKTPKLVGYEGKYEQGGKPYTARVNINVR